MKTNCIDILLKFKKPIKIITLTITNTFIMYYARAVFINLFFFKEETPTTNYKDKFQENAKNPLII